MQEELKEFLHHTKVDGDIVTSKVKLESSQNEGGVPCTRITTRCTDCRYSDLLLNHLKSKFNLEDMNIFYSCDICNASPKGREELLNIRCQGCGFYFDSCLEHKIKEVCPDCMSEELSLRENQEIEVDSQDRPSSSL